MRKEIFTKVLKTAFRPSSLLDNPRRTFPVIFDDVLVDVLCFCDISTVLSMSEACKRFHSLAFSRTVWLALICGLHDRNFIDLFPGQRLQDLPVTALVDLAKRTVQGPRSWTSSGLTVARLITLNTGVSLTPGSQHLKANLLSGGRFVLFTNMRQLRCWSVAEDKLVWEYEGDWGSSTAYVDEFSAEVIDEGRAAVVAVGLSVPTMPFLTNKCLDVIHLDLCQGMSYSIIRHDLAGLIEAGIPFSTQVCGDFAIARLGNCENGKIYLLKLSTKSCRTFTMQSRHYEVELIPGYMILVEFNTNTSSYLRVWDTNTLMGFLVDRDYAIELDVPPILSETISFTWYPGSAVCLSAHASPLQWGLYIVWLSVVVRGVIIIHRYCLSVIQSRRLSFHRTLSQPLVLWENYFRDDSRISYAGHANVVSRIGYGRQILPLAKWILDSPGTNSPSSKWRKKKLKLATHAIALPDYHTNVPVQLSAYSGALII